MVKPKQINLLPREISKKIPREKRRGINVLLVLAVFGCGAVVYSTSRQMLQMGSLKLRVNDAKRQMYQAKLKLGELQSQLLDIEKEKSVSAKQEDILKKRFESLQSAIAKEQKTSQLLAYVAALVPDDLWITRISLQDSEVQIAGTTYDPELITLFMNALNKSSHFRNSRFTSSEKQMLETQAVQNFTMIAEPVWD